MNKGLCWLALCLLAIAGCSAIGGSSGGSIGRRMFTSGWLRSESSKESFAKAVENDPFPRADQPVPRS